MVGEITTNSYIIIPIIGVYVIFLISKSFIVPFARDMDFKTYYSLSWGNLILFLMAIFTAYFTLITDREINGVIIFSASIFLLVFFYIFVHMFIIADPSFEDVYCKVHVKKSNANKTKLYKTSEIYAPRSSSDRDDASKRSQYIFILLLCLDVLIVIYMGFLLTKVVKGRKDSGSSRNIIAGASAFVAISIIGIAIAIITMYNEIASKKNMLGYETKKICKKKGKLITNDTC